MKSIHTILSTAIVLIGFVLPSLAGSVGDYPAYTGQKRIAIIMLSWADRATPGTRQNVVDRIWNNPESVRNYYIDMSRGTFEFLMPAGTTGGVAPASTPDVYGPYELSIAAGFHQDVTYANAADLYGGAYVAGTHSVARTLAMADGYNAANYDYIMYITPKSDETGGIGGYAGYGANYSHMFDIRQNYLNHEIGHNLYLSHSNLVIDQDDYGSQDCVMGNGNQTHLDGPHTYQLGWYPDAVYGLRNFGQYGIENLAQPDTDNLKVLRFDRAAVGAVSNPSYNLWVEYRIKGVGQDAGLNNNWDRKVNIHYCRPRSRRPGDLGVVPGYYNNNVSKFDVRGEYTDPDGVCTVRFVREESSTSSAVVQLINPNGNQPPSVTPEQTFVMGVGSNNFSVLASDPENDSLSYTIVSPPAAGSLSHSGGTFTYTGSTLGSHEFTVRVNDGVYDSYDEVLQITVVGASAPTVNAGADRSLTYDPARSWTPSASQAVVWLDASDGTTITETAGALSQWADKSGKGHHATQATSSRQPAYDSIGNKLSFGGDDIMQLNGDPFHGLQDFAVIALQKWNASNTWSNTSVSYHGDSNNGWQLRQRGANFDQLTFTRRLTDGNDDPSASSTINDSDFIGVGLRRNSADLSVRHNGTLTYSASNDTGSIPYSGVNRSGIGGRYGSDNWGGPGNFLNGDLKEVLVIANASIDDVEKAEGYLAHKWSMTAMLPASHPYKTETPIGPPAILALNGSASDSDGDVLTLTWSVVSGPGIVNFTNAATAGTTATFSTPGEYVLRLTASDGINTGSDEMTVTVLPGIQPEITVRGNGLEIASGDTTPQLSDHTDLGAVGVGSSASRTFTISNDGGNDLILTGSPMVQISGSSDFSISTQPAASTISGSSSVTFSVTFTPSASGIKEAVISIPNNDSNESPYTFTVSGGINTPPLVNAGADRAAELPNSTGSIGISLSGASATDPDGDSLSTTWTIEAGTAGGASIANPTSLSTNVTFTKVGSYTLRLTADDGLASVHDELTVTVTLRTFALTYSGNGNDGGSAPVDTRDYEFGDYASIVGNTGGLTKSGYSFTGWNTASNGSGQDHQPGQTLYVTTNVTLYAQWGIDFNSWSGGLPFDGDANADGVPNGLAWLLGATNPQADAQPLLPEPGFGQGGSFEIRFRCKATAFRGGADLKVQASDDVGISDAWTNREGTVPDGSNFLNGIYFDVTGDPVATDMLNVKAIIFGTSPRCFMRLLATAPPDPGGGGGGGQR